MAEPDARALLTSHVRDIPDFPQPGIVFRDICPLLADPTAFATVVDELSDTLARLAGGPVSKVLGMEARGFIVAVPVAERLGAGFVPVRKAGKLPGETRAVSYTLEYGEATLEIPADSLQPGDRVVIVDDVLATGGTLAATIDLVEQSSASVAAVGMLLELALGGHTKLGDRPYVALRTIG